MDEKITITVKTATGKQYSLQVSPNDTIAQVKKALEPQCEIAADQQRLIYSGHLCDNAKTLQDYGTPPSNRPTFSVPSVLLFMLRVFPTHHRALYLVEGWNRPTIPLSCAAF